MDNGTYGVCILHTQKCTFIIHPFHIILGHSNHGVRVWPHTLGSAYLWSTPINSNQLWSLVAYSDMLCIGLCRLCDVVLPLVSAPPHVPPLCLCVCLCILVPQYHVLLALFVYFLFQIVSIVDRQWANIKSNCTHCIRRGLSRRLRSSLLLNPSPRCDLPCRILYLTF